MSSSPWDKQVGGKHYKSLRIQPTEYIAANGLGFFEGNVVKYVTRHQFKGGKEDILKAIHYLELLLDAQYSNTGIDLGNEEVFQLDPEEEAERASSLYEEYERALTDYRSTGIPYAEPAVHADVDGGGLASSPGTAEPAASAVEQAEERRVGGYFGPVRRRGCDCN